MVDIEHFKLLMTVVVRPAITDLKVAHVTMPLVVLIRTLSTKMIDIWSLQVQDTSGAQIIVGNGA